MTALEELTELVRKAAADAGPSVVSVGRHGRGSGFVVAPGRVVTNAHNLRDRTTSLRFADGRTAQGTVTGSDIDGDLVVLDVDTGDAPPLPWSEHPAAEGDIVIAVTAGCQRLRATWGQITGADHGFRGPRGRRIAGAIEHTAPSAAGSSGAPVLDRDGKVVAVNTHRVEHGFYLARAADDDLRNRVAAMGDGRNYDRARLGVALAPPHVAAKLRRSVGLDERDGLLVRGVVDESPAAGAGIREGDLLVGAGDRDLVTADDLFAALADVGPGSELAIRLVRGSEELTVTVTWPAGD
jgi:S1-C subfamily serine protease